MEQSSWEGWWWWWWSSSSIWETSYMYGTRRFLVLNCSPLGPNLNQTNIVSSLTPVFPTKTWSVPCLLHALLISISFIYSLQNVHTACGAHPDLCSVPPGVPTRGWKRPGRKADHWPPSSAEVKTEWSYTSAPAVCVYGVGRESLPFTVS
jgi:hypothetical protein